MTKDLISVIIPCYNVSKYLEDTFKSLQQQTYKNIEVIFVNDGSTDDCLQKIETFCKDKPWCKVVSTQNQGLAQARNEGIKIATGEFLYFYDSDDILHPTLLERMHQIVADADVSLCTFKRVSEDFKGKYKKISAKKVKTIQGTEKLMCESIACREFYPNVWNKLYRHEIVKKFKTYPNVFIADIRYGEDLPFNVEYFSFCTKANFVKEKLYYYRQRKGSLVHSSFKPKMLTIYVGHKNSLEVCKPYKMATEYIQGFICITCVEMLFRIYASKFKDPETVKKLYEGYLNTIKSLKKSKRFVWYKRCLIPPARPFIWLLLRRKMKTRKK